MRIYGHAVLAVSRLLCRNLRGVGSREVHDARGPPVQSFSRLSMAEGPDLDSQYPAGCYLAAVLLGIVACRNTVSCGGSPRESSSTSDR